MAIHVVAVREPRGDEDGLTRHYVYSSDGQLQGVLTGGVRPCACGKGAGRLRVRWPDGSITWPCSYVLRDREGGEYQVP